MYLHICPHKHTHTISFFYIYNKKIFKITFLKLKIQELFQALTHSASAFSFQQTKFEVTLCGGGGAVILCVEAGGNASVLILWTARGKIKRFVCLLVLFKHICTQTHTYTHTSTLATIFQTLRTLKVLG